jgi:hypothetical protein
VERAADRDNGTMVAMSSSSTPVVHDLRALLRSVGGMPSGGAALLSNPGERPAVDRPVELLDDAPVEVATEPLAVLAFVDGVQSAQVLAWHGHRPVFLTFVAAAAVGARLAVVALDERLEIFCAELDAEWARSVAGTVPVRPLKASVPGEVESEAFTTLGALREETERSVVAEARSCADRGAVVLDGTLVGRPHDHRLFGVVKSTDRRYLADESVLWGLRPGWRSPRFVIPAGMGAGVARYSCYLRLFSATNRPWNFSLIRLEAFNPDALDALAARCLLERQGPGAADARWERHLGGVRQVEDYLRSRRPPLFG